MPTTRQLLEAETGMRYCTLGQHLVPAGQFTGSSSWCKACRSKYNAPKTTARRRENKAQYNEYMRNYRAKKRAAGAPAPPPQPPEKSS